jgi:N-acetylmuramoyl-L-alanine amidase
MRNGLFIAFLLCLLSPLSFAQNLVKDVNFIGDNQLEINFAKNSVSKKVEFKFMILENPDRLVIDLKDSKLANPDYKPNLPSFTKSFRNRFDQNSLRLVFDLNQKISVKNSVFKNDKITTEIIGVKSTSKPTQADFILSKVEEFDVQTKKVVNPDGTAKYVVTKTPKTTTKIPVIVIDAGHGGKDPGTIGNFARTKEKDLTLAYAKEFAKQLMNTKHYKVYLTRDSDVFLPLKTRVEKARKKKADLFISIHVNAIDDHGVSGFSIYTLSEKSSDKQAEILAKKENQADIINGVDFSGASKDIMKTLIDLSQRETKNSSSNFANITIKSVKQSEIEILQNTHRFAGFAVLTAPDMASTLIELGYLSNKQEEKLLNSLSYKRKVAASLVRAVDEYFSKIKS